MVKVKLFPAADKLGQIYANMIFFFFLKEAFFKIMCTLFSPCSFFTTIHRLFSFDSPLPTPGCFWIRGNKSRWDHLFWWPNCVHELDYCGNVIQIVQRALRWWFIVRQAGSSFHMRPAPCAFRAAAPQRFRLSFFVLSNKELGEQVVTDGTHRSSWKIVACFLSSECSEGKKMSNSKTLWWRDEEKFLWE